MDSISNDEAEKLLRRALKHLSAKYKISIELDTLPVTGAVCLTYGINRETAIFTIPGYDMFPYKFTSMSCLLHTLVITEVTFEIYKYPKYINISFSKEFGTSIEELKVRLDLVNI